MRCRRNHLTPTFDIEPRFVTLKTEVDSGGRCETPVGKAGRLRPRRLDEEAQVSPHGKGATWSCNQLTYSKIVTQCIRKQPSNKTDKDLSTGTQKNDGKLLKNRLPSFFTLSLFISS